MIEQAVLTVREGAVVDLNLVRVFTTVYESRSLTAAARRLFVTQPAVSQALGRLRRQCDDALFERVGSGMQPTPLADTLYPEFRDAVSRIDRALGAVHGFDPATSERAFRIALSELGEIGWLAAIARVVGARAPRARLEVVPLDNDTVGDELARGAIDLAVTSAALDHGHRLVKRERYLVAMGRSHPLAAAALTVDDYRAARRVWVTSDSSARHLAAAHRRLGGVTAAVLSVQHFVSLPDVLMAGECIATIPETLARGWAENWPIAVHDAPFAVPDAELHLYRRPTTQHLGALDWFAATVGDVISATPGRFAAIHASR
ncbi:LysR family transcriptional regulator [Microbacterium kribbense]|uniref:LysR family transcriptional regulator n=1 Tax=Microbacterium kribbense TaxID=433645 RepID=A0ABP7GN41_9MICO